MPAQIFDPRKYIRLIEKTAADVTADMTDPDSGLVLPLSFLLYFNADTQEPEIITLGQGHPVLSKGQHDAVIDDAYTIHFSDTWPTIEEARVDGAISIFVRSAGDTDPITIASTDSVQRIQGKDADTTELPVSMTINKDDVTVEQLLIPSGVTLTLAGQRNIAKNVKITGSGQLKLTGIGSKAIGVRLDTCTAVPVVATNVAVDDVQIEDVYANNCSGANLIDIQSNGTMLRGWQLRNIRSFNNTCTGYLIKNVDPGSGGLGRACVISGVSIAGAGGNGGLDIQASEGCVIEKVFATGTNFNSGKSLLRVTSVEFATNVLVSILINGIAGGAGGFTWVGPADAIGLTLSDCYAIVGKLTIPQNAVLNNVFVNSTAQIDFGSNIGIKVSGGDMTGVTPSNIPADIVFRNVKGQDDRGHYIPVDNTVNLGSATKRYAALFSMYEDYLRFSGISKVQNPAEFKEIIDKGKVELQNGDSVFVVMKAWDPTKEERDNRR